MTPTWCFGTAPTSRTMFTPGRTPSMTTVTWSGQTSCRAAGSHLGIPRRRPGWGRRGRAEHRAGLARGTTASVALLVSPAGGIAALVARRELGRCGLGFGGGGLRWSPLPGGRTGALAAGEGLGRRGLAALAAPRERVRGWLGFGGLRSRLLVLAHRGGLAALATRRELGRRGLGRGGRPLRPVARAQRRALGAHAAGRSLVGEGRVRSPLAAGSPGVGSVSGGLRPRLLVLAHRGGLAALATRG